MFDFGPYDKFYRRRLPHWQRHDSWHFITFRLVNSLPKNIVKKLRNEEREAVKTLERLFPNNLTKRKYYLHSWKFDWIDEYLDKLNGKCYLHNSAAAEIVVNALAFYYPKEYDLDAWCVMPNHIHVLLKPRPNIMLPEVLKKVKRFSAKEINKLIFRKGIFWQHESYDHWLRPGEFLHRRTYIMENTVKARLCEKADEWKWSGIGKP